MKSIEKIIIGMLKRVKQFGVDHPLDPPVAKATASFTELDGILTGIKTLEGSQDISSGTLRGTTVEKATAADNLLRLMRQLSKIAKVLDKALYPTIAYEMRTSHTSDYPALLQRGRGFITALVGKAAVFIEHGAAATVEADLAARVAALDSAINHKGTALCTRVGCTAGLGVQTRQGVRAMRKLDAILSAVYAEDPVLLAGWTAARRIYKDPVNNEENESGEPSPAPAGSGEAPAEAPSAPAP